MLTRERYDEIKAEWQASPLGAVHEGHYSTGDNEPYALLTLERLGVADIDAFMVGASWIAASIRSRAFMRVHHVQPGKSDFSISICAPLTAEERAKWDADHAKAHEDHAGGECEAVAVDMSVCNQVVS
jgi:hypothetical protein